MNRDFKMYSSPYSGTNNRKKTKSRLIDDARVQSIPIYEKDKVIGYKYIRK